MVFIADIVQGVERFKIEACLLFNSFWLFVCVRATLEKNLLWIVKLIEFHNYSDVKSNYKWK